MHEIALGSKDSDTSTIDSAGFSDCLAAAQGALDVFLSLDMSLIRALPTLYLVRLIHVTIVLVKLHFAAKHLANLRDAAQKTASLEVEEYLARLIRQSSGWGTLWPASKLKKNFERIQDLIRRSGDGRVMASELAWLNVWTLTSSLGDHNVEETTASAEQAIVGNLGQETLAAHSLDTTEGRGQTVPNTSNSAWDQVQTAPSDIILSATNDFLPSSVSAEATPWDNTLLDSWFEMNMNTSLFDFGGDLQSTIQYQD